MTVIKTMTMKRHNIKATVVEKNAKVTVYLENMLLIMMKFVSCGKI